MFALKPRPLFLDFEASSLAEGSWPIEWGLTWFDDVGVATTKGNLISPDTSWSHLYWSKQSQAIHRITQKTLLQEGQPASQAAQELCDLLQTGQVVSDNPAFEYYWLSRLTSLIDMPTPQFLHLHHLFAQTLSQNGQDMAFEYLHKTKVPHRAKEDSLIMATAWKRGIETDTGSRPYAP